MLVGIGSFAFTWALAAADQGFDESTLLSFARQHALPVVQVGDNLPVHAMSPERLSNFIRDAERSGVWIELGARGLTDAHLETYLGACRRCRSTLLRFVADAADYRPSPQDLISLLRNAERALAAADVTLALENHDRFTAATLRHVVESVASRHVGVCLDTANSLGAGEGLAAVTRELSAHVVNLHVKDVAISRLPHLMGFLVEGRLLGAGQLPIGETVARVAETGRCRSVILEAWTTPCELMTDTIRKEIAGAERSIQVLKNMVARLARRQPVRS